MRKQIAAANWKMNLTYPQAENLLTDILNANIDLKENQQAVFAVPSPYLIMTNEVLATKDNYFTAAQNCYNKKSGALPGKFLLKYYILLTSNIALSVIVKEENILEKIIKCLLKK